MTTQVSPCSQMASAAPCRTLRLAQTHLCVWDLEEGTAERAWRRPTNGIGGCDDQKGRSRTQKQGQLLHPAAATHWGLPRGQPPLFHSGLTKTCFKPKDIEA